MEIMQKFSDFSKNKFQKKIKNGSKQLNFVLRDGFHKRVFILHFFPRFSGKVSEQYDQISRKSGFLLKTTNNDMIHKDES